jgi:transcriptional antiterminator NusG
MAFRWYVVHTYSGFENKVKVSLLERIESAGMQAFFSDVLVPEEDIVELVSGEKKTSKRKFFPGYVLVKMELNDDTWHIVKNTPKVTVSSVRRTSPTPFPTDVKCCGPIEEDAETSRCSPDVGDREDHRRPVHRFVGIVDEVKPAREARVIVSPAVDAGGARLHPGHGGLIRRFME